MELTALLYYRSKLDNHDQAIYDTLVNQWMHFEDIIQIAHPHCDFLTLTRAIHFDYPLLFYINYYNIAYVKSLYKVQIQGSYLYQKEEAKNLLDKCEVWGTYIRDHIPAEIGIKEKALWLHDVILNNVKYGDSNGIRAHNLIGVVKDKEAVCEGISMTYKFLCDLAGIPCIYVIGTLNHSPHGWNMLWVDGGTSFVDVTNDMTQSNTLNRKNFLRSSSEMYGYTWDKQLIPECNLRNLSNSFEIAHNTEEVIGLIKKSHKKDSISICLQFSHPLQDLDFKKLLYTCVLRNPALAFRKITYSLDRQMVFIDKY